MPMTRDYNNEYMSWNLWTVKSGCDITSGCPQKKSYFFLLRGFLNKATRCVCGRRTPPAATKSKLAILSTKATVKVIEVIWKGFTSWVCMPNMKSLSLSCSKVMAKVKNFLPGIRIDASELDSGSTCISSHYIEKGWPYPCHTCQITLNNTELSYLPFPYKLFDITFFY